MVERLLRRFIPGLDDHLSDERMADLFCRELPLIERWIARRHLTHCWHCRIRQEDLEGPRAQSMLQLYHDTIGDGDMELPEKPRAAFAQWLELHMPQVIPQKQEASLFQVTSPSRRSFTIPAVSIGVALSFAVGMSVFSLWWRSVPNINADTLLVQAKKWDLPSADAGQGVVHQTIQIKTARQKTERSIYWDLQGKRQPKHVTLPDSGEQLWSALSRAGVNWDRPISASAYQAWHEQQLACADRITRTGAHLLTLTTTVPDGFVSEESLTVRDTDFHPVGRTVDFRDNETVEIAELDFKILPWSAVDTDVFESIGTVSHAVTTVLPNSLSPLHLPEAPSLEQLDEAELAARLILNQLHADTGEQIEIHRSLQGVEVNGLVETDERKRELKDQLMTVPRVKVFLQSLTDLSNNPVSSDEVVSTGTTSLPDYPSALETYLRARGRSVADINTLAQRLFNSALKISQESKAIADLKTRFVPTAQMSVVVSATLADLLYSHHERLETLLRQERTLLAEAEGIPASGGETRDPYALSLADAAARNLALLKELTETNVPAPRGAEAIFADMSATVDNLAATAHEIYEKPQENSVLSRKR